MAFSQLKSRVLVAIIGGPLVVLAVYYGRWANLLLLLAIQAVSMTEFFSMSKMKGAHPRSVLGILTGAAIMLDTYFWSMAHTAVIFAAFLILTGILEIWQTEGSRFQ
ncbi:MAG TPA: hypothetical protein ENJ23_04610, partial [Bacteroidetes bacterium]|nr:hypothetical protein [Bacteroidota bacterium]